MEQPRKRRLFGTDGIRGTANMAPMTAEVALKLGQAAGMLFTRGSHRHRVIIGKDTRLSGYMLEPALTAGFCAAGMNVTLAGPLPTPAIAMLTRSLRLDLGVVISASHNPFEDNGIKLFGPDGAKLSDETEAEIEALMETDLSHRLAAPDKLGRASRLVDAAGRYIEAAKASLPRGLRLDGLRIVLDCAHGAAYKVAPAALWELGATVISIGVEPDGFNINKGVGSTAPDHLCAAVLEHGADVGIALDGDADRVILADERGEIIDGDQILGLIARDMAAQGRLIGGGIVATVMSNLGLERFLAGLGLGLHRTQVGDRYVAEAMRTEQKNLGGEQSGHVILSDFATTGDGLIAALQVLAVLVRSGRRASEACRVFEPLPQLLRNVRYAGASPLAQPQIQHAIAAAGARLDRTGRVLIRASGTEPLIRGDGGRRGPGARASDRRRALRRHRPRHPGRRSRRVIARILTIAGSDSGGGAGIEADIKTITALGGYALTTITAVTAQNTLGVFGVHTLPADFVRLSMQTVLADIGADAIKLGMLANAEIVEAVAETLPDNVPLVLDPVMVATSGAVLLPDDAIAALKARLIPRAAIITPNLPEAAKLTGLPLGTAGERAAAGRALLALGAQAVLIKGGHDGGGEMTDILVHRNGTEFFTKPRIETRDTHGTGCTLASAIATGLAQRLPLSQAIRRARDYLQNAIATAPGFGAGHGPVNHLIS